ncbi:MAG: aminotransferase class I/II-fold pyridoxal phosphate-dependent enzyme, partial [Deltaproteobacteria bacterium]|nr:aminotransferase class I/II-fold pyridoxal phosphate-dependent enzyme [Deltaproteobacteria bacterium]
TLILDKRAHTSTMAGVRHSGAAFHTFRHNRMSHLEKLLQIHPASAVLTESLFSMDGDSPDFEVLKKLKRRFNFISIVDEAHAVGVLGPGGRGLSHGVADIVVGTFGKAFGLFGAFLLLPRVVREYLINFGQGFIYTTALPPWFGDMAAYMLTRVSTADDRRAHLAAMSEQARARLTEAGFDMAGSAHILAVRVGDENRCQHLAQALRDAGILVFAARYPTVPLGRAILRVCLTRDHTLEHITRLRDALVQANRSIS